jgi:hypothetical protein
MKYRVRRQDDHGNVFNASIWFDNLADAITAKENREQFDHKQMYWIEDEEGQGGSEDRS